ncbi:MAG: DUF2252 domain-containing protein [Hyphomicrobiales bacterium]|nr:DUF2252 domain-containing protein [Hyphomicrobiales bacterium]
MTHASVSRAQRFEQGKALRVRTPREAHADLVAPLNRDAVAILAETDASRLPELLPERYKRMTANPFAFLRGAAAVMAADLAREPTVGAAVQVCGDCHLMNFGAFSTPEDNIVFDINDFDETLGGVDFTVDLKRLAASVAVAARTAGLSANRARSLASDAVAAYRQSMFALMELSPLEIWHARIDLEQELKRIKDVELRRSLAVLIDRARHKGLERDDNFPHLVSGPEPRIADKPPTIFHFRPDDDAGRRIDARRVFSLYRATLTPERAMLFDRYQIKDLAFKAVGVGSVGTFCCVGLFLSGDGEPLFLQVKEAQRSALEQLSPALAYQGPQGRRVVEGQRMMQAASDIFLGWTADKASGREFYVRILKNRRLGAMSEIAEQEALADYARLCGRTLARAHARPGDPAVIAGYMGRSEAFDDAIASFALAYAAQTARDHAALVEARRPAASARTRNNASSERKTE